MTEAEARRAQFEALSDGMRNKKIGIAVNAASGAYTGFSIGGPIGAGIGAALGGLIGWWGMKTYRARVYAELEAAGLIKKRRTSGRSTLYRMISDEPGFLRFPHSETVGYAVIEVLEKYKPHMSQEEINREAYAVAKTFHEFRRELPDIPIEIGAEVILMLNGIRRNPDTGEYEQFEFELPEDEPVVVEPERRITKPGGQIDTETLAWLLAGVVVLAVILQRSR